MKKYTLLFFTAFCFVSFVADHEEERPPFVEKESPWADELLQSLTIDEKIGQLFNVAAYSNRNEDHQKEIIELIKQYHIGGLTFFQGGPKRQAQLTNLYQETTKIPLMVAIDGEWGLSMRLDSTVKYPWQMTLGAVQDNQLIHQMGQDIAEQCRRIGVHVNFAPVVDVNNNPQNPVIFARSFGEDKRNVAAKGVSYMEGMQSAGVIATAKHFPGHGDTDADSHKTLPVVNHSPERIFATELYPFRELVHSGIGSIMTAHLSLPQMMKPESMASSLSPEIVEEILIQKMGYEGLIFTDGLNMGGVAKYQKAEQIDLQAIIAGNDVLLLPQDIPKSIELIKAAIQNGTLSEDRINRSVHKILKAKEWLGLHKARKVAIESINQDLNKGRFEALNRKLVEASLTLLRNEEEKIPLKKTFKKRIVSLAFSHKAAKYRPFQRALNLYAKVDTLHYEQLKVSAQKALMDTLLTYDEIIISMHKSNKNPWISAELNTEFKNFINVLRLKKKVILTVFANPYSLRDFLAAEYVSALIMSYQNSTAAQELTAQLIFGSIRAKGKLPISISEKIKLGDGLISQSTNKLQYGLPEEVGLRSEDMAVVDKIVEEGLIAKAYPGAQVWIAKSGNVIYHKAFGFATYDSLRKVKKEDLYDLASVTKISSTLLAVMDLDGKGKIDLDATLGDYLKMCKKTPYEDLVLRDILAHQAGLAAWIPFYNKTLHKGQPRFDIYSKAYSPKYSVQVAKDFYMIEEYRDTIFYRILNRAKVNPKKEYWYSDVGYYFLKEIVEEVTKQSIDEYNQENFYGPLGMSRTTFQPLNKFSLDEIMPTENDQIFRKQLIHGYVHDPGAAMQGGIGGHAGLFSTANDLGILMQMYLQGGQYAGKEYLQKKVLEEYSKCQFCKDSILLSPDENRRGAGFDKPAFHGEPGPTCDCISYKSYGHSGFTGTYAWVDPEEDLVYVFLSNRVYPDANNKKLLSLNIRTRIQEAVYAAISNSKNRNSPELIKEEQSQ